ncbi:pilus assembly protein CpaE [Paenarthrobacter sp. Z7-10]|uniref:pilus assembly protein CpaE n=1 Tax=Paenarthrobacter sp. Z7-10 TaxID=2787635 RepID=UPI0022A8F394|nr:pilus assembly protein CpaE [Paenarthrobacter sp. Z7-10]MCZ2402583.1 pilus assembly protein CpaE [Paenarthrobacter sp. Z7-10]
MISTELARALRRSGLIWSPASGDNFCIERLVNSADPLDANEVFVVSDMTIEAHSYPTGTVLGMNGTTEWALDSVDLEDSLWLPREDQLRDLLAGTFRSLRRESAPDGSTQFLVELEIAGRTMVYEDPDAAEAYGNALFALLSASAS